jgi:hypothetical protein
MCRKLISYLGILSFLLLGNTGCVFAFPGSPEEARSYLDRLDTTDSLVGMYEMRKDDFCGFFLLLPAPEEEPLDDYVARVVESSNPYDKPGDLKFFMRRTQEKEVFFGKYYDATSLGVCEEAFCPGAPSLLQALVLLPKKRAAPRGWGCNFMIRLHFIFRKKSFYYAGVDGEGNAGLPGRLSGAKRNLCFVRKKSYFEGDRVYLE